MNDDPRSHGLWESSAPAAPATRELEGDLQADVVILGAGFTGCSAALHLAQRGVRAIVLEKNDIGFGGSGRNVGLVNAGMWVMPDELPRVLGAEYGERLLTQLGEAPSVVFDLIERFAIDCEVTRTGTLHCAVGRRGLEEIKERARQWQARGADVVLLVGKEVERLVGTQRYEGALLDRRAGTIQPLAYVRGLAKAAIELGASVFIRSAALRREDVSGRWKISTARGSVTAGCVLLATDVYSTDIGAAIKNEQVRLPYFQLATAPLSERVRQSILPERQGAWDTKQILSSFRLDRSGRLIFGSVGALRGGGAQIHRDWSRRELIRLFPQLGDVAIDHEWFGMIGMTADALPRLHIHDRQVFSISGYNGRGIGPGTVMGRNLARLALGDVSIHDLPLPVTDVSPASLRTVKEAFYEVGAQLAHFTGARI
ncbi:NAD(P)/FAD-dependent oxidoreductase [Peristeroidobacter soli]|uniref:NAD(P)/FAD-dependent oxidoreductase n=1 Tax=Peristeroidobacter soli TaxID=2497877 RepID=UPI00101E1A66|nr:FAD-binding oxidoreductase [Peristeroidobacter soli]